MASHNRIETRSIICQSADQVTDASSWSGRWCFFLQMKRRMREKETGRTREITTVSVVLGLYCFRVDLKNTVLIYIMYITNIKHCSLRNKGNNREAILFLEEGEASLICWGPSAAPEERQSPKVMFGCKVIYRKRKSKLWIMVPVKLTTPITTIDR